jgi:GNAT superfamily N-acetyltransferase
MVKFCDKLNLLDPTEVGRKDSVRREVKLLCKEFDGELSYVKKTMWSLKSRAFVSFYCGRICVATLMMENFRKRLKVWSIANAVVDKRARRKGLGRYLAWSAINLALAKGANSIYLGAQLDELDDTDEDEIMYEKPKNSATVKFWKKLNFKKVPQKEYNRMFMGDYEGIYPMKMTKGMRSAKEIPSLAEILKDVFPRLRDISKRMDGKNRVPMLRLCCPDIGDVKIKQNSIVKIPDILIH